MVHRDIFLFYFAKISCAQHISVGTPLLSKMTERERRAWWAHQCFKNLVLIAMFFSCISKKSCTCSNFLFLFEQKKLVQRAIFLFNFAKISCVQQLSLFCWDSAVEPDDGQRQEGHHGGEHVDGEELVPEHHAAHGHSRLWGQCYKTMRKSVYTSFIHTFAEIS